MARGSRASRGRSMRLIASGVGVLVGVLFLVGATLAGRSGIAQGAQLGLGLGLAVLAGVATVCNTLLSKSLSVGGWSPRQIMAVCFWLLLALAWVVVPRGALRTETSLLYISQMIVVAGFGVALPLYLLQLGIEKVDPLVVALLVA